jgi:hypothetical protein
MDRKFVTLKRSGFRKDAVQSLKRINQDLSDIKNMNAPGLTPARSDQARVVDRKILAQIYVIFE